MDLKMKIKEKYGIIYYINEDKRLKYTKIQISIKYKR